MGAFGADWFGRDGNGVPDLVAAKAAGLTHAFRKLYQAPYGGDGGFAADWKALEDAKVPRGFYILPDVRANAAPAEDQVAKAAAVLEKGGGLKPNDLAPGFDVEFGDKLPNNNIAIVRFLERFVQAMHDMWKCWPIEYTATHIIEGHDVNELGNVASWLPTKCPLWIKTGYRLTDHQPPDQFPPKGYPKVPAAWAKSDSPGAWFNQYQGDAIKVPGFNGTVDLNRFLYLSKAATTLDAPRVSWVQRKIVVLGAPLVGPLAVTGSWDADTEHAVRAFQTAYGLASDGIIGPATFAVLSRLP